MEFLFELDTIFVLSHFGFFFNVFKMFQKLLTFNIYSTI